MKRKAFLKVAAILLSALLLASCASTKQKQKTGVAYVLPEKISSIRSGTVAENERMVLHWDMENTCVLLEDKSTGAVWSTIPYEYYGSEGKSESSYVNQNLCSMLQLKYVDGEGHVETDINSDMHADYVMAQRLKTGLRLTYYFDEVKISVPVSFRLEEDGVAVSVEVANIGEAENQVYEIALLPFFASVKNSVDSYLFVPSGSGALMYADDDKREARDYREPVYGEDSGNQGIYQVSESETVRMPVFGAKSGENACVGIITSGAETAQIAATAGDERFGFSAAYAIFTIRGKAAYNIKGNANTNNRMVNYSENKVALKAVTVKYAVLDREKSDYNGMAEYYRHYLIGKGMKTVDRTPDALLTVLGGVKVRRSFLGFPYDTVISLTSFSQAEEIVADIRKGTDARLAVNLKGFGESGLDAGKYAGGFKAGDTFGGKKGLKNFTDWCKENSVDAFFDFDLVFFTKNYKDYKVKNAARNVSDVRAKHSNYDTVKSRLIENDQTYLIDRYSLATSPIDILSAANNLGLSGIGLSTLTDTAFSDYSRQEYYCKAHMSDDVHGILASLHKKQLKTFGESANDYAAARLDYIFDAPTRTSSLFVLDEEIPFYQMVFRGYTGLSGSVINSAGDSQKEFLKSVMTGSALAFTLADHTDSEIAVMISHSSIGLSVYSGLREEIKAYINRAKPLYEALGNATIERYERNGELSKTVFNNGVTVVVNLSENDIQTEFGELKAQSFIFDRKAGESG